MKTKFVVTMEIEVKHPKGTFIDQNSVKSIVGTMLNNGRRDPKPWCYDGKNEGMVSKKQQISLRSLSEYVGVTSFGSRLDIKDIEEYA